MNGGKYGRKTAKKQTTAKSGQVKDSRLFSGRACVSASQLERELFFLAAVPVR
jgi:hypothetical protein